MLKNYAPPSLVAFSGVNKLYISLSRQSINTSKEKSKNFYNMVNNRYWKFDLKCALSRFLFSLVPKKKNLVLFTSWFGKKYIDNTKYVYEYLLDNSDYNAIWMTKDQNIYRQLKKEGKPVELFSSLRGKLLQIRAMAVFSTVQFSDYNPLFLTKCIYLDLGHGHPIKDAGSNVHNKSHIYKYQKYFERVHYYSIVSSTYSKRNRQITKNLPDSHIFVSDFARNDVFIDEKLRTGKNKIIETIKGGRKAIVYMPTHRADGKEPMFLHTILPLKEIQEICIKKNYVFIVKKHYYHSSEEEDLNDFDRIFDITNEKDIDPQILLCQADVLISDYSACYVDYMLLRRPIIFYHYDYDYFSNNIRSLLYDFKDINIAPIAYSKKQLCSIISNVFDKDKEYIDRRMEFANRTYFDNLIQSDGREKVKIILDKLMSKYFGK